MVESESAKQWLRASSLGPRLAEAFEGHSRFCRALCFLFQVETASEVGLQDLQFFTDYTGPSIWRKSIKAILKMPEPQGPNWTETKQASRELLRNLHQDAIRTAATSGPGLQLLSTLHTKLIENPQTLQHRCCRDLAEVLNNLVELEKQLRQGATQKIRQKAIEFTRDMVEKARRPFVGQRFT